MAVEESSLATESGFLDALDALHITTHIYAWLFDMFSCITDLFHVKFHNILTTSFKIACTYVEVFGCSLFILQCNAVAKCAQYLRNGFNYVFRDTCMADFLRLWDINMICILLLVIAVYKAYIGIIKQDEGTEYTCVLRFLLAAAQFFAFWMCNCIYILLIWKKICLGALHVCLQRQQIVFPSFF